MPATCPYCNASFPHSDTINARHKAVCAGWREQLGDTKPRTCLCGHEATSLTQMKRHRAQCEVWKTRHRGTVQMERLAETLQRNHGEGVVHPCLIPEAEDQRKATNRARYGAENVFAKESSVFSRVQASLEGKRPVLKGEANPFAWPETQDKIRHTVLARYGVENPQQSPAVREKTRATNLDRFGVAETLASPEIRAKIVTTNQQRYGGPAPSCSSDVVERARQTNLVRWGFEWTAQHPEVRQKQLDTMQAHYGAHYFASDEGKSAVKAALVARYGVEHPSKINGFWEKAVNTFLLRYGVSHPLLLAEILDKRRGTCQARYGVDNPMQSPEVYKRAVDTYRETCLERYGVPNAMLHPDVVRRALNAAQRVGPNLLERRFASLNPELLYVGNGAFWRWLPLLKHHKNPDFILPGPVESNPKKGVSKVVEVFGNFWHSKMFTGRAPFDHEQDLVAAYRGIGIECLVVWESEVKADPASVRARVEEFLA